ncbi:MAG: transposase [Nitrospirae bacterium]|nr:transposase [Nitrospirota bacterium]MBF0536110.1 transposase [Nitrospirota bacterium]MBF0616846.1 transposase [Nitrospirota bacterium]
MYRVNIKSVKVTRHGKIKRCCKVYLKEYADVTDAIKSLRQYFMFYNNKRPHQQLNHKTPKDVYTNT